MSEKRINVRQYARNGSFVIALAAACIISAAQLATSPQVHADEIRIGGKTKRIPIRGQVTAIQEKGEKTFLKINIGSKNGVFKNLTFRVHRGTKFLGNLKVLQVDEEFSVGVMTSRTKQTRVVEKDGVLALVNA